MQPSSTLSPSDTIQGAFNDALPLMRSRQRVWIIFAIIAAVGGLIVPFLPATTTTVTPDGTTTTIPGIRVQAVQIANLLGAISTLFVIGSVLRTVRPNWHWTVLAFFTLIGIGIVFGVCVEIGLFLLIVPGVFLAVRWSQAPWCYLLSEGKNPFGESWEITKSVFWQTLLFLVLLWLAVTVLLVVAFGIGGIIMYWVPFLAVLMLPAIYLAYTFAMHVSLLAQVRWLVGLRAHAANAPAAGTATAPATS